MNCHHAGTHAIMVAVHTRDTFPGHPTGYPHRLPSPGTPVGYPQPGTLARHPDPTPPPPHRSALVFTAARAHTDGA